MPLYEFRGKAPTVASSAFVHPHAVIIGDAVIGDHSFIGPGAVIRADFGSVVLGAGVSLQDNAVIHVSPDSRVSIGDDCIIAHGALLHDVRLGAGCIVGMGAILLFDVVCEKESFVAAGAVVSRGTRIESGTIVGGNPATVIKDAMNPEQRRQGRQGALLYRELTSLYRTTMKLIP